MKIYGPVGGREGNIRRYIFETDLMQLIRLDYIIVEREVDLHVYNLSDENQEPILLYRSKSNNITVDLKSDVLIDILTNPKSMSNISTALHPDERRTFERCIERAREIREEGLDGIVTENLEDVLF